MDVTLQQKFEILRHIRFEIAWFFLKPALCDECSGPVVEESITFGRMGHCRILREFFTREVRGTHKDRVNDDVLAKDFCFPVYTPEELFGGKDNAKEVEKCFNKRLFHLTYSRLGVSGEAWRADLAFPPVEAKAKEFVKHIVRMLSHNELTSSSVSPEALTQELKDWQELEKNIGSVVRPHLQADKSANTSNMGAVSGQYVKL